MAPIEHELQLLKADIIKMSQLVTQQMRDTMLALTNFDKPLASQIITVENDVNDLDLKIDRHCEDIFALHNPVAQDLRLVLALLRINYNLERVGDIATSIAKFVKKSSDFDYKTLINNTHALQMFEEVNDLLVDVMDSFKNENVALAKGILSRDELLNKQDKEARQYIIGFIKKNPEDVEECLKVLSIVRKLERGGDQCKSIAQEVIFFIEAKILKHSPKN